MIALIADVHLANHRRHPGPVTAGINRRCRQILDTLEAAVQKVKDRRCKGLIVLGDLFDTTNPPQQVVAAVQKILRQVPTWVLMGNHDQVSTEEGDHALGPLEPVAEVVADVTILKLEPGYDLFLVPFQPSPAIDWLPALLEEWCGGERPKYSPGDGTALLLHLGISDVQTPGYMRGHHDVVSDSLLIELCTKYGFNAAFAGNWHWHKVHRNHPLVVQVGTLAPTGFDNLGLDHGQIVYWDGKCMKVDQVPGPRFLKVRADEDLDLEAAAGCQLYVQIIADQEQAPAAYQEIKDAKAEGLICAGEVMPDIVEVRAATRKAAMVARSSDTLEEALAAYVNEMPLPDGVARAEVLAMTRNYLGQE